jgi:hypothetical protein
VGCTGMHKHKPVTRIGGGGRVVRHTTYSMAYITYRPIQHGCRFASGPWYGDDGVSRRRQPCASRRKRCTRLDLSAM